MQMLSWLIANRALVVSVLTAASTLLTLGRKLATAWEARTNDPKATNARVKAQTAEKAVKGNLYDDVFTQLGGGT